MAKPKFSEEVCQCIIEFHSDGIPLKYCAEAVGIARQTIYDWMRKGEEAKSGKYHQFYVDMKRPEPSLLYIIRIR